MAGAGRQRGGGMGGGRLVEQLDLNDAQKKTWEGIQADMRQKSMAAAASAGGDRKAMREAMRKNMDEAFAKLAPVLKPEQKTKLAALRASMAQGGGGARAMTGGVVYVLKDGKPSPVPVRVGATDGTNTQIVGPLKPGDQVITGGGPKGKPKVGAPFGGPGGGGAQVRVRT
jgi:HlyD family secretion protein